MATEEDLIRVSRENGELKMLRVFVDWGQQNMEKLAFVKLHDEFYALCKAQLAIITAKSK